MLRLPGTPPMTQRSEPWPVPAGADRPVLVRHVIALADDSPVQAYLDAIAPLPAIDPPPPDTSPIRGLLRTTINAILYATSASVEPERRTPPASSSVRGRGAPPGVQLR